MSRLRPSQVQLQRQCDAFNAKFSIGSTILVHPGTLRDDPIVTQVAAPGAYVLGGHTAVVQVEGRHGCIALTHVRPYEERTA